MVNAAHDIFAEVLEFVVIWNPRILMLSLYLMFIIGTDFVQDPSASARDMFAFMWESVAFM